MTPFSAFVAYAAARSTVEIICHALGWDASWRSLCGSIFGFGAAMLLVAAGEVSP